MSKVPGVINSLRVNDVEKEEIQRLSALNYTPQEMALFLGLNEMLFCKDAALYGTDINLNIRRGKFVNKVQPEIKLQEEAESGSLMAIQELRKLNEQRTFETLVKQMDDHEL